MHWNEKVTKRNHSPTTSWVCVGGSKSIIPVAAGGGGDGKRPKLRSAFLHATTLYPLRELLSAAVVRSNQFYLSGALVLLAILGNLCHESANKTPNLVQDGRLIFCRGNINGRVFGEEICRLEVNLMCLDWPKRVRSKHVSEKLSEVQGS